MLTRRFPYGRAMVGAQQQLPQAHTTTTAIRRTMVSSPSSFESPSETPFPSIADGEQPDFDFKTKEFMRLMYHSRVESPVSEYMYLFL